MVLLLASPFPGFLINYYGKGVGSSSPSKITS